MEEVFACWWYLPGNPGPLCLLQTDTKTKLKIKRQNRKQRKMVACRGLTTCDQFRTCQLRCSMQSTVSSHFEICYLIWNIGLPCTSLAGLCLLPLYN